jgi:hypothetical protein
MSDAITVQGIPHPLPDDGQEIYDLLSDALGPHENEAHGAPVPGIRTLMHQRDDALRILKQLRWRAQEDIDCNDVKAKVRFNGGNPVLLCHLCHTIMRYGVDPKTAKAAICPEGHGCGAHMDKVKDPMDRFLAPTGSDE